MAPVILVVNPGSTSTKAALFSGERCLADAEIEHPARELARFASVMDQLPWRMEGLRRELAAWGARAGGSMKGGGPPGLGRVDAVAGRGGFLRPVPGGAYAVGQAMLDELAQALHGEHASNLGAFMARELACEFGCPALVADPPVTDELIDEARLTGHPRIMRRSVFHALSQRFAAREAARRLGVDYARSRFIVAHLGGGISVGAHRLGRVADVTNAIDGEGPMSPQRCGALPALPLLELITSGGCPAGGLRQEAVCASGLLAHLGSADLRQAEKARDAGDPHSARVLQALAYQIAKAAGSMAAALEGPADAVVLTGGMARSGALTGAVARLVAFLGPVEVVTGTGEMAALAENARLALAGEIPLRRYPSRPG